MQEPINHYGHNVDVTSTPFFCSDCDVEFDINEQLDMNSPEVELGHREWLLGQYTTRELHEELARRGYSVGVLLDPSKDPDLREED